MQAYYVLAQSNRNGKKGISLATMVQLIKQLNTISIVPFVPEDHTIYLFNVLDDDKSGFVTLDEVSIDSPLLPTHHPRFPSFLTSECAPPHRSRHPVVLRLHGYYHDWVQEREKSALRGVCSPQPVEDDQRLQVARCRLLQR